MTGEQQDGEQDRAELKRNILLSVVSLVVLLGFGWGLTVLFGCYWIFVDFEAAPTWSVWTAFIAMPFASVVIGFAVGDGSVVETGVKTVIVGVSFFVLWGRPWLDPILLATLCGLAALALVALTGRILAIGAEPDWQTLRPIASIQRQPGPPVPQISKAELRRRDDEDRRIKSERERREYEARRAGDEKPAKD